MARRAAKVDGNQAEIVRGLRAADYLVSITSQLGNGYPDLNATKRTGGPVWIIEVKRPGEKLTEKEHAFHIAWRHCPYLIIIYSLEDALEKMGDQHGARPVVE